MPRIPRKTRAKGALTAFTTRHLLLGVCLVGPCGVCRGGPGLTQPLGVRPWALRPDARDTWERHKEKLLALWRDPSGPPPDARGFSVEALRGAGRTGLPCWAEVIFDSALLPKRKSTWPADVKKAWQNVKDELCYASSRERKTACQPN